MEKSLILSLIFISLLSVSACKQLKKPEAQIERENWYASFNDSIENYKNQLDIIEQKLSENNNLVGGILNNFQYVKKPRQVSGFYLLKGWESKIPFSSTGIYARINDAENLELIASLSGASFNFISVSNGSEKVQSNIVPHDQALNYKSHDLNTVCFSGSAADSIAQFIAMNISDKITLSFCEAGKTKQWIIPDNEKNMIAQTWELVSYKLKAKELQKDLWIFSRKMDVCRRMLENQDSISKTLN